MGALAVVKEFDIIEDFSAGLAVADKITAIGAASRRYCYFGPDGVARPGLLFSSRRPSAISENRKCVPHLPLF